MDVKADPQPNSSVKLTISITPAEMADYFKEATKQVSEQVPVAGFRKGKTPRTMLENRVGKDYLSHQALEMAVTKSYYDAVIKHNLKPIGRPQTDIPDEHHHLERDGLTYTAMVPVMPEVKLGDYKKVRVKPVASAYSDKLVEETLEQLRKGRAGTAQVTRAAKKGDRVEIDFVGTLKGKEIEGAKSENHPLVIGEDSFVPGFADELVGMKTGQLKEFTIKFPKDYHEEKLRSQKVKFTVTMKQVQEVTLPAIDDAFAKQYGAASLADLKKRLAENLKQEKEQEARRATEAAVVEKVVAGASMEVPAVLIEDELTRMMGEFRQQVEKQGIPFDKYLEHLGKDEAGIRKEQRDEALRRVKTSLALNAIQETEGIKAGPKEIKAEIDQQLAQAPDEAAKQQIASDEFKHYVARVLGNRQAVAKLVEQATK